MRKIEIYFGTINEALKKLEEQSLILGEETYCEFNGKILKSSHTIDEAYLLITGKTKQEFDLDVEKQNQEYEKREREFKEQIPQLIEEYKSKARGIIAEKHLENWDRIVPIRLSDLYHGIELGCWLDLISILNDESTEKLKRFEKCREMFYNQGHSGMSTNLVMRGLIKFHELGNELVEFINK